MLMRYAVKRLASAVVVLVLMIVAMFILQSLSPADPARALAGDLKHGRTKVAGDAIVGNGPVETLVQDRLVEPATAAGMASEHC